MPQKGPCQYWRGSYYYMQAPLEGGYDLKSRRNRVHSLSTCPPGFEWFFLIDRLCEGGRLYLDVVLYPLLFEIHARSGI